jgi:acyl carrier protein
MSAPFAPANTPILTRVEIAARVQAIVLAVLQPDIPRETVTAATSLAADLAADSLDMVEVAIDMECTFNVEIDNDALERIETVGDAAQAVIDALAAAGRPVAEAA